MQDQDAARSILKQLLKIAFLSALVECSLARSRCAGWQYTIEDSELHYIIKLAGLSGTTKGP